MKRYLDLSEGVPCEALNQIETLQTIEDSPYIEEMVEVYTRGKEIIVVLNRLQEGLAAVTLDMLFNHSKYYRVNERIAKAYLL